MIFVKILALFSAVLMTACASPEPKEVSMDWSSFIASVPGTTTELLEDEYKYKTSTIKNSLYRYGTGSLEESVRSFERWCKAHSGVRTASRTEGAFYDAAFDWIAQERAYHHQRNAVKPRVCIDDRGQLVAAMLVRQYYGYVQTPLEENKLPAPVIAFYTPEQAAQFTEFHKARRAESDKNYRLVEQYQRDRQNENTRRLRALPKIGDKTEQGIIIDLRPPLALIQYDAIHRLMFQGAQSNWIPINELVAPR